MITRSDKEHLNRLGHILEDKSIHVCGYVENGQKIMIQDTKKSYKIRIIRALFKQGEAIYFRYNNTKHFVHCPKEI
ncbi:hypothetical protein CN918_29100 [Priestia megaterium]|nr:hypothetical protein CN918_29100 [Priestia megaterium]